jgi:hypothetical protein
MNLKYFFKKMYWSAKVGRHIDKETGKDIPEPNVVKMPRKEGLNAWEDELVYIIIDASNQAQEANSVATIVVNTYNRETKRTLYSESFPIVKNTRFGLGAWNVIKKATEFRTDYGCTQEFKGALYGMSLEFDPVLSDNLIVVGEVGKNPIIIEVLDLLET